MYLTASPQESDIERQDFKEPTIPREWVVRFARCHEMMYSVVIASAFRTFPSNPVNLGGVRFSITTDGMDRRVLPEVPLLGDGLEC